MKAIISSFLVATALNACGDAQDSSLQDDSLTISRAVAKPLVSCENATKTVKFEITGSNHSNPGKGYLKTAGIRLKFNCVLPMRTLSDNFSSLWSCSAQNESSYRVDVQAHGERVDADLHHKGEKSKLTCSR